MNHIIVDANTWACVFSPDCQEHGIFKPVLNAINERRRALAWGGSHYIKELKECGKYLGIHIELQNTKRAERFDDARVDEVECDVSGREKDKDFDDPHIIALQIISHASVICSKDIRAYRFFKKQKLYPKRHTRPKIYSSIRNQGLIR